MFMWSKTEVLLENYAYKFYDGLLIQERLKSSNEDPGLNRNKVWKTVSVPTTV